MNTGLPHAGRSPSRGRPGRRPPCLGEGGEVAARGPAAGPGGRDGGHRDRRAHQLRPQHHHQGPKQPGQQRRGHLSIGQRRPRAMPPNPRPRRAGTGRDGQSQSHSPHTAAGLGGGTRWPPRRSPSASSTRPASGPWYRSGLVEDAVLDGVDRAHRRPRARCRVRCRPAGAGRCPSRRDRRLLRRAKLRLALCFHHAVFDAHNNLATGIARLREHTESGAYTYSVAVTHFIARLPLLEQAARARWTDGEERTR